MNFSLRINDLEARSCDRHLFISEPHDRAEIVKWGSDNKERHCFTVAYWEKSKDGYNLKFVGNRPFEIDTILFMDIAKQGQRILDDIFDSDI
jgi:hypothetical protein